MTKSVSHSLDDADFECLVGDADAVEWEVDIVDLRKMQIKSSENQRQNTIKSQLHRIIEFK